MYKFVKDGKEKYQETLEHKDKLLELGYALDQPKEEKKKPKKKGKK